MKTNQLAAEFTTDTSRRNEGKHTSRPELEIRNLLDLEMVLVGGGDGPPTPGDAGPCW